MHDGKNDAEIDKRNEKKIKDTGSKDRYDYFNQLKVAAETTLNKSLENKAMAIIGEPLTPSGKSQSTEPCTKCKAALTDADLKYIKDIPANFVVRTTQILPHLNKYMEEFGINKNCQRRAHFLGQVAKETGFWSFFEDLNHSKESLNSANFPNRSTIIEKRYYKRNGVISLENEIRIGNIGYGTGTKASGLGNNTVAEQDWADPKQDGYKYRGRGLIQLTGKSNYTNFQTWYNKHKKAQGWADLDFVKDPDLLSVKQDGNKISNPEMLVLSAIYFWDKNNFNSKADIGYERTHTDTISIVVNGGEKDAARAVRHELFTKALSRIKDESTCALSLMNKISLPHTDVITYRIYEQYKKIIKQTPTENKNPEVRKYVYYDKDGKDHAIGDFTLKYAKLIKLTPKGGTIREQLPKANADDKVELIYIKDFQGYESADKLVKAKVALWDSNQYHRWYINPECFAGLIGAMLDLNIDFLAFRGTSKVDGSGGGSSTHNNGVATDIAYFNKSKTTVQALLADKELDLQLNIDFINKLISYGYKDVNRFFTEPFIPSGENKARYLVDGMGKCTSPPHNNHLHIGGFDFTTIIKR